MTRSPIDRRVLSAAQQQKADTDRAVQDVLAAVEELLGESTDPDVVAARDELTTRFVEP